MSRIQYLDLFLLSKQLLLSMLSKYAINQNEKVRSIQCMITYFFRKSLTRLQSWESLLYQFNEYPISPTKEPTKKTIKGRLCTIQSKYPLIACSLFKCKRFQSHL